MIFFSIYLKEISVHENIIVVLGCLGGLAFLKPLILWYRYYDMVIGILVEIIELLMSSFKLVYQKLVFV